jgi:hypothetical protein
VEESASTDVSNVTHCEDGKFAKGNKLGKGNPHAQKIAQLKAAVLDAVTAEDVKAVISKLVSLARDEGDVAAAKVLLDRVFGKEVVATIETHNQGGATGVILYMPANPR